MALTLLLGCGAAPSLSNGTCGGVPCPSGPPATVSVQYRTSAAPELDVLVVVDDTAAVAGIASSLPDKLGALAQVLANLPNGQPPMHVAFIPGSVPAPNCPPAASRASACGVGPDSFLTAGYCNFAPNVDGPMTDAFACLADYGASGCGTFQPLEAARRALADAAHGGLTGRSSFHTPGAWLAILVLAGQDDASPDPVETYLSDFASLAPDGFSFGLLGPTGCPVDGPIAPAQSPRLNQFAGASEGATVLSVCDPSFKPVLTNLATSLGILRVPPALEGLRDTDPTTPGLQPSCTAQDDVTEADGTHVVSTLAMCDAAASVKPCLSIVWDSGRWTARIQRREDPLTPCGQLATLDTVSCLGCADANDPACATMPAPAN